MKLGLEDKKKTTWAAVLGAIAVVAAGYVFIPLLTPSSQPTSSTQPAAPATAESRAPGRSGKAARKLRTENLDPTLRLDLLAAVEQTQYRGNGRNIFVSQAEPVDIPAPVKAANTDPTPQYTLPTAPIPTPIPLKFYGFASRAGEPKRIFLSLGEDVFVAGEGEVVDRRYKVIRISPMSVEIQDVVNSGPPQSIPLTQG
ncbi:MAG TPA: hypothetical protein VMG31_01990 [Verrucomicrobiae bacterium]|nr:hypothetical protein [Verrucomicrobiae bacterium]